MEKKEHPALSDSHKMCEILSSAFRYGIKGSWEGDAYRSHPCGMLSGDILFINERSTHKTCSIKVANEKGTAWKPADKGRSASISRNSYPYPKPLTGRLFTVWSSGRWVIEGPWQQIASDILFKIEADIKAAKDESERRKLEAIEAHEDKKAEELRRLQEAWS